MMEKVLWTIQIALAMVFFLSGAIILFAPRKIMAEKLPWVKEYSSGMTAFICLAKIAGAIGLILPIWTDTLTILTPLAAVGIGTIMILALVYHLPRREFKNVPANITFLAMAGFIAFFRF